ncbi:MAG TPA: GNAT family N-acetyltransferase [Syntrophales bacterium]|nr:GNAT family N-acetyltransferase [Syntrophales bacterium]
MILNLLRQSGVFNTMEITVAMELVDEVLEKNNQEDYQTYSYYDDKKQFMGYICFGPIPMTDFCYDLYWIAVDKQARGKGAAAELVGFMEKQVGRQGGSRIYVDTSSTPLYEAARRFYEKQGYSRVCILEDFYREGDSKIIFMKNIDASKQTNSGITIPKNE